VSVDELAERIGLDSGDVAAALAELELLGLVRESDGRYREVSP
jgi:predicted Rossmann fold nucleotide-binding protein DprA/Smf involved in DNA uptake